MSNKKDIHVVRHPEGGWATRREGADRVGGSGAIAHAQHGHGGFGGSGRGTDTIIYAGLIVGIAVFYPNGLLGWLRARQAQGHAERASLAQEAAR